ncbi:MAG: GntR family transcriptional regulator [Flavobacteriales bacterium]|nr:GntR family transcriptional regulator [Flavobacteriales bacterium]
MIHTGRTQELTVLRRRKEGLYLGDGEGAEVLLPHSERPDDGAEVSSLRVFVHRDQEGKQVATVRTPKAQVGEFALLKAVAIRGAGAHMDWGLEPPLLAHHEEQQRPMEEGRYYVVRVALGEGTDRLYASSRVERFLDNSTLTVKANEEVALMVFDRSELGLNVIVNNIHQGLIHHNEVFRHVSIGDRITGYVRRVRDDHKLDIVLQPIGYRQYIDAHTAMLAKRLEAKGMLPLTDKSSAAEIHAEFGISKKAFKKALGALYKERLVRIGEDGVVWVG